MDSNIYNPDELTHWGVKGMRWGIRRYQNKDGTLTDAGKKRLAKESAALKKEEQIIKNRKRTKAKIDKLEARRKALDDDKKELEKDPSKPVKKTMKEMSDAELKAAVSRAQQEWQYLDYNKKINDIKAQERERMSTGKKFVVSTMHKIVEPAISNAAKGWLEKNLKDAMGVGNGNQKNKQKNKQQNHGNDNKNKNKSGKKNDLFEWDEVTGILKEIATEERNDIKEIASFVDDIKNISMNELNKR